MHETAANVPSRWGSDLDKGKHRGVDLHSSWFKILWEVYHKCLDYLKAYHLINILWCYQTECMFGNESSKVACTFTC